ncbi:hypothetical protein [Rothia terrae]|uniref:hypothetical protein n=1 Tax=Rothia terrae TaxID=396015 RepID=UPI0033CAC612
MKYATGRIIGIDLARFVALVSMFVAHTAPSAGPGGVLTLSEFLTMPLFAALLGASAYLSLQHMNMTFLFASSVVRGIVLIALGMWLDTWGASVDIILQYFGVLSIVVVPLVLAPSWVLAVIAAVITLVNPYVLTWGSNLNRELVLEGSWLQYLANWTVAGSHYRVFTMVCWAAVGIIIARGMQRWGVWGDLGLALVASAGAIAIYLYTRPTSSLMVYSGARLEVFFNILAAATAMGWCALVARAFRAKPQVLQPLTDTGSMTLSLYVLQIGILAAYMKYAPRYGLPLSDDSWWVMSLLIVVAILFAVLWKRLLGATPLHRGPFESILAALTGRG